ncbi:Y-family DNA polymerase [Devosia sp.]|uniref:Y-family DNA polymerase n=1 Tax=Devosia sp. TaxID=1871048 RepID=UPI002F20431C
MRLPRRRGGRRHLALFLPRWATDCLRRADPELGRLERPLVLWERRRGAMRLVAVDALAARAGLTVDQNLSDARALVPNLEAREIDPGFLAHGFAEFADWHSYASPIVAVLAEQAPWGDLCLDITGVAHLFGGEEQLLATVTGRLAALGLTVTGAIAPSIGAAWALAHFDQGRVLADDEVDAALGPLPVAALRLSEAQLAGLSQMGLKRVGQLYGRDRKALAARFGASLVTRLDQALGQAEERLVPRLPVAERFAERRFAEPIGLIDDVLMTAQDLAIQLALRLEAEGLGAQSFHLFLYRVDHKVMRLAVNAARATRDAGHIARLFANRAERLVAEYDPGFGIDMIRLAATSTSPLDSVQLGAFETADGARDLDRLYDRMTSRLGPLAVVRSKFVNTHIPERAVKLEPVVARTPDDPAAAPDGRLPRPLRLLPSPEPIGVTAEVPDGPPAGMVWRRVRYRFVKASGPERIGAEWWQPDHEFGAPAPSQLPELPLSNRDAEAALPAGFAEGAPVPSRDYYVAEDDGGRRFWLFRDGPYGEAASPRWYLHGFFA